ncbi:MAG: UvrD-helicase domain-containing protein [Alphaproteobacteria bacterium]|nr:UvrD-helicase domain-containing protein [Alphaproteobacteria bacterium]
MNLENKNEIIDYSMELPWLNGLNSAQQNAVTSLNGPLLVLSGAGTGKTRVLTSRLAQLIASKTANPYNILAVTFTNKAAREMRLRAVELVGPMAEQITLGTFHSVAAQMLRRHAELVGLKSNFTILDSDDQLRLIKQIMEADGLDLKRWPPRMILGLFSRWKDRGLTADKITKSEAGDAAQGRATALYKVYQERLLALNAADFGDLLLHMLTIFNQNSDILQKYQKQLTHIVVDEYQDTNIAQYLWLRLLSATHSNLCCVGDDDQSIYGWRGAEVGNILKFEKDFPGSKIVRLEENYRSTGHILASASKLIANNEGRLGKSLFTSDSDGEKIRVAGYWDGNEEARSVSSQIEFLLKDGQQLYDMAVLVRAGYQTREFEERFIAIGLPYRVVGTRFYERAEIRDALCYLRLVYQQSDDLAFERIINTPKRGLGEASLQMIYQLARAQNSSLFAAASSLILSDELKTQAKRSLAQFVDNIVRWHSQRSNLPPAALAEMILEESGYTTMWQMHKSPDAPGRLENLKELVSAIGEFDSLSGFLEHISLVMDNETQTTDGEVTLMTLHAAKGLEFDTVFLPGWEEGIFPSQRTLEENGGAGLEEERRLAYVGITRARRNLFISFAANRRIHGLWQSAIPSRFIAELPQEHLIEDMARGLAIGRVEPVMMGQAVSCVGKPGYGPGWQRMASKTAIPNRVTPKRDAGGIIDQAAHLSFNIGDRVFHQKFGMGDVLNVESDKLDIQFDKAGRKKVISSFVSHK